MVVGHDRSVSGKYFASNTLSQQACQPPAREIREINDDVMIAPIIQSLSASSAHHPPSQRKFTFLRLEWTFSVYKLE